MGVTIDQYRARIGSHNNVIVKQDSTPLEDINFCGTMLMLFQLVITIMVLLILVRIFSLSIFLYFPTKRLAEQYESLSQVIMSFTQMSCYNVYVPLLLKMSNDVEENAGPTI